MHDPRPDISAQIIECNLDNKFSQKQRDSWYEITLERSGHYYLYNDESEQEMLGRVVEYACRLNGIDSVDGLGDDRYGVNPVIPQSVECDRWGRPLELLPYFICEIQKRSVDREKGVVEIEFSMTETFEHQEKTETKRNYKVAFSASSEKRVEVENLIGEHEAEVVKNAERERAFFAAAMPLAGTGKILWEDVPAAVQDRLMMVGDGVEINYFPAKKELVCYILDGTTLRDFQSYHVE